MSLLLLALPAVASGYTLCVFGNANGNDTINIQDVTYTELIIFEYQDAIQEYLSGTIKADDKRLFWEWQSKDVFIHEET